jgi:hypothetical protein
MLKPKIFIVVEGGLVQGVWGDHPLAEVTIIDRDILKNGDPSEQTDMTIKLNEFTEAKAEYDIYPLY